MIRLGLCCIFRDQPIQFRTTTATAIKRLSRDEGRKKHGRCGWRGLVVPLSHCDLHLHQSRIDRASELAVLVLATIVRNDPTSFVLLSGVDFTGLACEVQF